MEENQITEVAKLSLELQDDKIVMSSLRSKIRWRVFYLIISLIILVMGFAFNYGVLFILICFALLFLDIGMLYSTNKKYSIIKSDIEAHEILINKKRNAKENASNL